MSAPRESAVLQLVREIDDKHDEGHKRLRGDYREHEERLSKIESVQSEQGYAIKALQTASPELSRLKLSPGMVIGIISIVVGQVASTWGIRSDIRDINTQMTARVEAEQNLQKLQEERATTLKAAVDAIGRKQELLQIQIQDLERRYAGNPLPRR